MAKKVNATRMELLRLKRRILLAKKGHKLLKDKLDGLIQKLLEITRAENHLSRQVEDSLVPVFQALAISSGLTSPEKLNAISLESPCKASVGISLQNIMGVKIPKYDLRLEGDPVSYRLSETSAELDRALIDFRAILTDLVKLAELNKAILVLASQIIEIKRRVNALEYILIPELEATIRQIRMKLSEMERSGIVALLKIKEVVR